MGRYEGKLTVNKLIKDVPTTYAGLFESARWLSTESNEPKTASQLFNEMVHSYCINEMGWSEEDWQVQVQATIELGMSEDGITLNPNPDYYPYPK